MSKPAVIMLVGLPASGKSTYAKELKNAYDIVLHSSDDLRQELFGNANYQDKNNELFTELYRRVKDDLRHGKSVIIDSTNINSKRRIAFLEDLKNIECQKACYIVATPYNICLEQNKKRDRQVPEEVIKKMYTSFQVPYFFEGWDNIGVYYTNNSGDSYGYPTDFIDKFYNYNQDSTYHKLTLGEHSASVRHYITKQTDTSNGKLKPNDVLPVRIAGMLHDCGKPFTKSFVNSKGETTSEAHYYGHENCGSYDSLFYYTINKPVEHAIIINLHMMPYQWENNSELKAKYKKLWGNKLFDNVMLLHEADKLVH